jgi:hypothetical protein
MRRGLLIGSFVALLSFAGSAPAGASSRDEAVTANGAGFNPATRKLEASFTIALSERINSSDGCYPAPNALAKTLAARGGFKTATTKVLSGVRRPDVVYLLRKGSNCNGVKMALRHRRTTYRLDSVVGEIRIVGANRLPELIKQNRGPLRSLRLVTNTFKMTVPHRRDRLETTCPGKSYPLGGGFTTSPVGADGEGVYPQSYERLGAQRGWHITAWLMDPSGPPPASRSVSVQTMCAKGLVPMSAPHKTNFVKPGETKTVVASCPKGQVLMSGGYQRFDFLGDGGDYPTESRAISSRAWQVSGSAYGAYGGELTAIAYCVRSKKPLLTEVSAAAPLPGAGSADVTTPPCPKGRRLTSGGFSMNGSTRNFFAGGSINANNTWTAHGYGFFDPAPVPFVDPPPPNLTAFGYCLKPGV